MDPQILAIVLLFAGILLIFAELFLPSGGLIAIMCVSCLAGSVYFAYDAWRVSHPTYWWTYISITTILVPGSFFGAFYALTKTSLGNHILLTAPSHEEVTPHQAETARLEALIGERGITLNLMTPGGLVKVNGERLHAISDALMIEANTEVEVVEIRGTRIVVRPAEAIVSEKTTAFIEPEPDTETEDPWSDADEA